MNEKYEHYSMIIQWSNEDGVYIVSVPELPGCKTHGETYQEAIKMAKELIELWIDANEEWGSPVEAPKVLVKV